MRLREARVTYAATAKCSKAVCPLSICCPARLHKGWLWAGPVTWAHLWGHPGGRAAQVPQVSVQDPATPRGPVPTKKLCVSRDQT